MTEPSSRRLRVLVVEDDVDSAASLAMMLELFEHEVEVAHDGPAAIDKLATHPDIILLDIGLPGMSGWDLATAIYERATDKRPFLIAITGKGNSEDLRRSRQAGIDLHLIKPVEPQTLEAILGGFATMARNN